MSVKERKPKRDAALNFAAVLSRDSNGRVRTVQVPGSAGKTYKVIIRRECGIQTECLCDTGIGLTACKGNRKTICYHAQAAVMLAASEQGKVSWCETFEDADRLSHLNRGQIIPVTTRQGSGKAYIVFTKKEAKKG